MGDQRAGACGSAVASYTRLSVTPRGTDWSLALLVGLLSVTGALTFFAGQSGSAWVFAAHDALGFALALVLVWKLRRVGHRLLASSGWDGRTLVGVLAFALVAGALGSGWSSAFRRELRDLDLDPRSGALDT